MQTDYSLADLAQLAGVTPRTVRYYIGQGLLPPPGQVGPGARYGEGHLGRLRLIRRLQREHLPLAAIRSRLAGLDDREVGELVAEAPAERDPGSTALEYVQGLLRGRQGRAIMNGSLAALVVGPPVAPGSSAPPPAMSPPAAAPAPTTAGRLPTVLDAHGGSAGEPASAPADPGTAGLARTALLHSQWERISFGPDVEIHVRRPLAPGDVRRLERLVAFARQLFEEDLS